MKDNSVIVVDDSSDGNEVKLRCLFDQVLSILMNEAAGRECIRPVPALLGEGQSLDLFQLFRVVRRRGGLDMVNGFWTFVAKELGLDLGVSASIKLIYFKYLYELERLLSKSFGNGRPGIGDLELEAKFRILLSEFHLYSGKVKGDRLPSLDSNENDNSGKSEMGLLHTKNVHRPSGAVRSRQLDDDEKICSENKKSPVNDDDVDDDIMIISKKEFNSRKRKRESLSRMLNWVTRIAKCPHAPSIGEIPPLSKWKDHSGDNLWIQVIRARGSLLRRGWVDSNPEQSRLQNTQKIHPSLYDDIYPHVDRSTGRSRCTEQTTALGKPCRSTCCNSCSSLQDKFLVSPKTQLENGHTEQAPVPASSVIHCPFEDEEVHIHVLVGPRFQANIPEWNGVVLESDSKWLGTKVWPLEYGDHNNALVEPDIVGKGRPSSCHCKLPGSVQCFRFHIAEKRMKLKLQIGPVFYHWRFDRMGEEVSLRWTTDEENRFKDMVRHNPPSLDKCFWDYSRKYFPRKAREELVSYYFNVFQVQRRSYQNRVTPKNIDSDDDESEFGCLSDGYGNEALKIPSADMLPCSENKEWTDFN